MRTSEACTRIVQAWEGIVDGDPRTVLLEPYICPTGYVTVGWGHVILGARGEMLQGHDGLNWAMAHSPLARITRTQAEELLAKDLETFGIRVAALLTHGATQNQFDAMVSLAFNIGTGRGGFAGSTVLRLHNANQRVPVRPTPMRTLEEIAHNRERPAVAADAFVMWNKGQGRFMQGLLNRRLAERLLYVGAN